MPHSTKSDVITRQLYDAVLFDLDGVITDTASLHATCWKEMFDAYLESRAREKGVAVQPFDIGRDYHLHVDGKPRYDGVRDFLESRGIDLPEGNPDDPADAETICGLGNRKDELVTRLIHKQGIKPYAGTARLIAKLQRDGYKVGVVTSSRNCTKVLDAAGLIGVFDVQVDGETIQNEHLAGKPSPETFLKAAKALGVDPARAVVIEDAISGVQAGAAGGFGLVIGVSRKDNADELRKNGAHLAVSDLGEIAGA